MRTMSLTDLHILMKKHLEGNEAVRTIAEGRIFSSNIRREEMQSSLERGPAVFVHVDDDRGGTDYQGSHGVFRVFLFSSSLQGEGVAAALSDAVSLALQAECLKADGVEAAALCQQSSAAFPGFEPDVSAFYVRTSWQINVIY